MKKGLIILINIILGVNIFSYKFEVIREYKFGELFEDHEKWPHDEYYVGPAGVLVVEDSGNLFITTGGSKNWIKADEKDEVVDFFKNPGWLYNYSEYFKYYTTGDDIYVYLGKIEPEKYDYKIEYSGFFKHMTIMYQTENYIFAQTGNRDMVCWELLGDGKYKYHTSYETRNLLDLGLREKFGITQDREYFYFGEFSLKERGYPNKRNIWKELTFKTPGYDHYTNLQSFRFLGTEKHGLVLHYRMIPVNKEKGADRDPDNPIHLVMGVLDPWTREVNVIELEPGTWDPPRNEYGLKLSLSQCIDPDGNIYFVDCNKAKGCYQIKKLNNDWLKQYDFYSRKIARVNANHIPLTLEPNEESENDGYNFEHEYLWILSQTAEYYYVRKVDGREGFIPKQYATLNPEVDAETIPEYTAPVQAEPVSVEPETPQEEVSPEPEIIPESSVSENHPSDIPQKQSGKKRGKDKKKKK